MNPPVEAWAFAITRARRAGYRSVVAPAFLLHNGRFATLHRVADGGLDENRAYLRPFQLGDGEKLWCLYEAVPLRALDVGIPGPPGDRATDEFGRPIRLIEGIVCRQQPDVTVTRGLFDTVHDALVPTLQEFFTNDSSAFPTVPCTSFPLVGPPDGDPLPLTNQDLVVVEKGGVPAPRGPFPAAITVSLRFPDLVDSVGVVGGDQTGDAPPPPPSRKPRGRLVVTSLTTLIVILVLLTIFLAL